VNQKSKEPKKNSHNKRAQERKKKKIRHSLKKNMGGGEDPETNNSFRSKTLGSRGQKLLISKAQRGRSEKKEEDMKNLDGGGDRQE